MGKTGQELESKLKSLEERARQGEAKAVTRQHAEGKLTARERLEKLLDKNSFAEEFMLAESSCTEFGMAEKRAPGDAVVTGHGRIDGRPVYVFAQDRTIMAGAVGAVHAEKISYTIETARKMRVPLIGLYDSVGARIQEGLDVTKAIGKIFYQNTLASGAIPQISAILGPCIGVAAYSPALTDIILMVKGTSQMFITGPPVIKEVLGEEIGMEDLGGSRIHSEISGVADRVCTNDDACLQEIRRLLTFLPAHCDESPPPQENEDAPQRLLDDIKNVVPEDLRKPYDIKQVIGRLADLGDFLELKPKWARNIVVGFGRLAGYPVGFVANQPLFLAGSLDVDASDKASRFVRFCDAFNLPIITLVDVPGYFPGAKQEQRGIIRHGAKMLYAYAESTVPKITVILRKGYGGAKHAMCTRELGADQLLVWPGVELAVMGGAGAVNVLYKREIEQAADPETVRQQKIAEYSERFSGPFDAVAKQFAQAAIRPEETRRRVIDALQMLRRKREERPCKKHGVMPS